MNPKQVAGVTGAVGLAVIGLAGIKYQSAVNSRAKRAILEEEEQAIQQDYDLEVDGWEEPDFVDEWLDTSENATDLWKQFNHDLGIELNEEDVSVKQMRDDDRLRRRKKGSNRRVNWNRLRENMIEGLHDQMLTEFSAREDKLSFYNSISGVEHGKRDPKDFGDEEDDEGDYAGFAKTAPMVQQFVDAFNCRGDGKGLWRGSGKTNIWALFPQAVPMFSEKKNHITDWNYYWKFFMKIAQNWPTGSRDLRFSIGSYHTSAAFTPRGYRYRANVPWSRMQMFYRKPRMQAAQPRFFGSLRSALTYLPRYGVSTPSAGDNCVMFWFFQDVPSDIDDFQIPEEYEMVEELHSLCSIIPIVVGPNAKSDMWKDFVANLMPSSRTKYAKDPDYNGAYYVEKLSDLMDPQLIEHVNKYQCLVANRATCRMAADAYVPAASAATAAPTQALFKAVVEDYDEPTTTTSEPTTAEPTTEGPETTAGTVAEVKTPEVDSCCGHDGFSATPFDSELKTCCDDGVVRAYEFEGDDPCVSAEFGFK